MSASAQQAELLFTPAPGTTVWWMAGSFRDSRTVRGKVVTISEYERATGSPWVPEWTDSLPIFTDQASDPNNQ